MVCYTLGRGETGRGRREGAGSRPSTFYPHRPLLRVVLPPRDQQRTPLPHPPLPSPPSLPRRPPRLPGTAQVSTPSKTHTGAREFLLLFPYYERGTVWDAIVKASEGGPPWPYPEPAALHVFMDACCGINAMHSHGFAHRDMKVRGEKHVTARAREA